MTDLTSLPLVGAADLHRLVTYASAVEALSAALASGQAPGAAPPRSHVAAAHGDLLLMPAEAGRWLGVKLVTVAPANPARGLPRVHGTYVMFDAESLAPVALIDGVALTNMRTPAVSALAVSRLVGATPGDPVNLVVFGTGPQGEGHVEAMGAVMPLAGVTLVGRHPGMAEQAADRLRQRGFGVKVLAPSSPVLDEALRSADVVVCATTAREPLFDSAVLRLDACVVAVGSHEPQAREVDSQLVARAFVVVESRATALREAGDIMIPVQEGRFSAEAIAADLPELVCGGRVAQPGRPRFFKSVGEAWEDLVVAALAIGAL